jgi:putative Holliday junction resolvase
MRLLGVDFGFKRIGLAVTDSAVGMPTLKPTIDAAGSLKKDAARLVEIAIKEQADAIVLGLPVQEDGEEGRMARICRTLGQHLAEAGLTVHFVDETLTSVAAEEALLSTGMKASQRRKLRDGEAAARILERYLNEKVP